MEQKDDITLKLKILKLERSRQITERIAVSFIQAVIVCGAYKLVVIGQCDENESGWINASKKYVGGMIC